jgi:hypothetical protein
MRSPLIASLSDLGVGVIITREVARDQVMGARYLGDALIIKAVTGAVLLIGVITRPWSGAGADLGLSGHRDPIIDPARTSGCTFRYDRRTSKPCC